MDTTATISSLDFGKFLKEAAASLGLKAGCNDKSHWQFFSRFIKKYAVEIEQATGEPVVLTKGRKDGVKIGRAFNIAFLAESHVVEYIKQHRNLKRLADVVQETFFKMSGVGIKKKLEFVQGSLGMILQDVDAHVEAGNLIDLANSAPEIFKAAIDEYDLINSHLQQPGAVYFGGENPHIEYCREFLAVNGLLYKSVVFKQDFNFSYVPKPECLRLEECKKKYIEGVLKGLTCQIVNCNLMDRHKFVTVKFQLKCGENMVCLIKAEHLYHVND